MEQEMNCITFNGKQCSKGGTSCVHICAAMGMFPSFFARNTKRNSITNEKIVTNIMTMSGRDKNGNRTNNALFEMVKEFENQDTKDALAENFENCLANSDVAKEDRIKLSVAISALREGDYAEANKNAVSVLKANPVHMSVVADKLGRRGFACEDYKGLQKSDISMRAMS